MKTVLVAIHALYEHNMDRSQSVPPQKHPLTFQQYSLDYSNRLHGDGGCIVWVLSAVCVGWPLYLSSHTRVFTHQVQIRSNNECISEKVQQQFTTEVKVMMQMQVISLFGYTCCMMLYCSKLDLP